VSKPSKQLWEDYPIAQSLPGEVYGLALSPDEQVLAVGGCGLRAASGSCSQGRLWLMATPDHPSPVADIAGLRFTGPPGYVTQVAFRPDGKLLASAGCAAEQEYDEYCDAGGEIRLWAVPAPGQALPLGAPLDGPDTPLKGLTFSLDGTTLAVCGGQATTMLWDLTDAAQPVPLGAPAAGQIDCRSPFTLEADGTVSDVEPGTGPLAEMLAGDPDRAVFSPDGAIAATYFRDITLWDLAEPSAPVEINQSLLGYASFRYVTAVAFSPDGLLLAATSCESVDGGPCQDSELRLWDVSEPRSPVALGEPLSGPAGEPVDLVFGPDGSTLAASSYKAIMLWEIGVDNWQERACQIAGRNLTGEEWQRHLGDRDYRETCP
jgi:WD40 repeat protein